ncbi:MAG: M23 family metallopeptidase, partial [Bacteroidota bacterium]
VGNTGKSTYPHLHFEVMEGDKKIDPMPFFENISAKIIRGNAWPSIKPLADTEITSGYGMRTHPVHKDKRMHTGVDFRAAIGTEVFVTANGTVLPSSKYGGYGINVIIDHGNGFETWYSNLSKAKVEVGQEVSQGEVIALSGNSGLSTGPHLHYEVRYQGSKLNPASYFLQELNKDEYRKLKNEAEVPQD